VVGGSSAVEQPAGTDKNSPSIMTLWLRSGDVKDLSDVLRFPGLFPGGSKGVDAAVKLGEAAGGFFVNQIIGGSVADYLLGSPTAKAGQYAALTNTVMTTLALAGVAEANTHAPFTYLFQGDLYKLQWANPQYIPTQAELDAIYLTDRIDDGLWECWTRANGNHPRPARMVRDAKQTKPGVTDVTMLARRGVISFDSEYPKRLRELGVTDPGHVSEYWRLSEYIPPYTDIMRMMIRDSADAEVVKRYEYDKGFEQKFAGPLKKWAKDQGIEEDAARYLWRAHWDTPSNTALYEMLHRLRPDRLEYQAWFAEAVKRPLDQQWFKDNPKPPVVTIEDARYLLEVNDMSPGWVEPLLTISYRPITNTDARRMYEISLIDEVELESRIRDNGYSQPDAKRLVQYEQAQRARRIGTQTGTMSSRKIMTAFREGLVDEQQADQLLAPFFPDAEVRRTAINRATTEREIETRRVQVRALVKSYVYGEIDALGLDVALGGMGIIGQERITVERRAAAARDGHMKEIRVQYVLDLLQRGITTVDQTADRLDRLGYSPEDVSRMIALAGAISTERQAARAIRASEKARAEARRQKSDAIRDLDRHKAELEKQTKAYEAYLKDLKERAAQLGGSELPP